MADRGQLELSMQADMILLAAHYGDSLDCLASMLIHGATAGEAVNFIIDTMTEAKYYDDACSLS